MEFLKKCIYTCHQELAVPLAHRPTGQYFLDVHKAVVAYFLVLLTQ